MRDFIYYAPTKVFFGKDKHKEIGKIVKDYGFDNIMLQYGQSSIKKSGLYDEVMNSLKEYGIKKVYYGHIHGNYTVPPSFVYDGIEMSIVSADYLKFIPKIVK